MKARLRGPISWPLLLDLASRHGLVPLLHRYVTDLGAGTCPPEVASALRAEALSIQARNLALVHELLGVLAACEAEGIRVLSIKGPAAAIAYYGDVAHRRFLDVDLLVPRADALRAWALIEARGDAALPALRPGFPALAVRSGYEQAFVSAAGLMKDLHWSLLPRGLSFDLPFEDLWARAARVALGPREAVTLGDEDALLFFCLHGAKHDWGSLAAVADVAQVARSRPGLDWERILRWSRRPGRTRIVQLGLRLARELLGAPIPDHVLLRDDPALDELVALVAGRLGVDLPGGTVPAPPSTWGRTWGSIFRRSMDRRRDQWRYLYEIAVVPAPADWSLVRLPASLSPLFYGVRAARLLAKHWPLARRADVSAP
jgi:hypothetical protein